MRIPVYLTRPVARVYRGTEVPFPERRLVSQGDQDRVIAILEAPPGTRIRSRKDVHGSDQLIVPVRKEWWARPFGPKKAIPAKYAIAYARQRAYGLSLAGPPRQPAEC